MKRNVKRGWFAQLQRNLRAFYARDGAWRYLFMAVVLLITVSLATDGAKWIVSEVWSHYVKPYGDWVEFGLASALVGLVLVTILPTLYILQKRMVRMDTQLWPRDNDANRPVLNTLVIPVSAATNFVDAHEANSWSPAQLLDWVSGISPGQEVNAAELPRSWQVVLRILQHQEKIERIYFIGSADSNGTGSFNHLPWVAMFVDTYWRKELGRKRQIHYYAACPNGPVKLDEGQNRHCLWRYDKKGPAAVGTDIDNELELTKTFDTALDHAFSDSAGPLTTAIDTTGMTVLVSLMGFAAAMKYQTNIVLAQQAPRGAKQTPEQIVYFSPEMVATDPIQ